MRAGVYSIAYNEEANVEGWVACADGDASCIMLVDTGSTDGTVALARSLGVYVRQISVKPWRFDLARNAALALLPEELDYCISLDLDERLQPGWHQALEVAHKARVTRPRYRYVWNWVDGHPDVVFARDHIHTRSGYRWKHPVHEILVPSGTEHTCFVEGLEVHHHADDTKERDYLPLLALAVAEDPDDDRNAYYYARELLFHGLYDQARAAFLRHLELGTWAPERAASMRWLAVIAGNLSNEAEGEAWLLKACAEAPGYREPWLDLCRHYLATGRGELARGVAIRALDVRTRALDYLTESAAWDGTLEMLAGVPVPPPGSQG